MLSIIGGSLFLQQLTENGTLQFKKLLAEYHDLFSLTVDKRGETDLIEFKIDTGDVYPKK